MYNLTAANESSLTLHPYTLLHSGFKLCTKHMRQYCAMTTVIINHRKKVKRSMLHMRVVKRQGFSEVI